MRAIPSGSGVGFGSGPGRTRVLGRVLGRRVVPVAGVVAAAAVGLLTACGSVPASHGASSTVPATPSRTPGAAAGLAACQAAGLKVTVDASQAGGAAGSTYYPVNFTNTSSAPCGLYGYPAMSLVTAAGGTGRQIGAAAQQDPVFGKLSVRLPAGGAAHAWLQVAQAGNYPASTCQPVTAHWLRVFPPGDTVASYVDVSFSACASASTPLLTVTPVRSGHGIRGVTP
jgi:hypothetical protein